MPNPSETNGILIGSPEDTVRPINPKDPKGAAELASVAAENMSKAAKALTDIPPPPKVPRH